MQNLRLKPGKVRAIRLLFISGVFVAIGIWMGRGGDTTGWLCAAFFGLGVLVGGVKLIPGSCYLDLSADGFEVRSMYRSWRVRWSDVSNFFPVRYSNVIGGTFIRLPEQVGWNYVAGYKAHAAMRGFAASNIGAEAALPDTYGRSAKELAQLLNEWRTKHSKRK